MALPVLIIYSRSMGREDSNWVRRWRARRAEQQQPDFEDDYTSAEKLLDAVNETARTLRTNYFTFLLACSYMGIIIASTTDVMLLKESPVTLPLLNVQLPITSFYTVVPWLVVLLHFYLMLHHYLLADRLYKLDDRIKGWPEQMKNEFHSRLISLPFIQLLISGNGYGWMMRGLLKVIVLITLTVFPLMLLCWAQMRFLPYHHEAITANHRYAVFVDIVILWFFWLKIIPCSVRQWFKRLSQFQRIINYTVWGCNWAAVQVQRLLKAEDSLFFRQCKQWIKYNRPIEGRADWSMSLIVFTSIALMLATFSTVPYGQQAYLDAGDDGIHLPAGCFDDDHKQAGTQFEHRLLAYLPDSWIEKNENQKRCMAKPTFWLYANGFNHASRADVLSFSRHLDLREQILVGNELTAETLHALNDGSAEERQVVLKQVIGLNLQKRDLRFAQMSQTKLLHADLRNAELQGAVLREAQLQGAKLSNAQLQGANLNSAQLQGVDLKRVQLQGANLNSAQLQGALLSSTQLQGTDLREANLQGALLMSTQLQGADLRKANLQGALLLSTQLQGADLREANLQGADFIMADLKGAWLSGAAIAGAFFDKTLFDSSTLEAMNIAPLSEQSLSELKKQFKIIRTIKVIINNYTTESIFSKLQRVREGKVTLKIISPAQNPTAFCDDDAKKLFGDRAIEICLPEDGEANYPKQWILFAAKLICDKKEVTNNILSMMKLQENLIDAFFERINQESLCPNLREISKSRIEALRLKDEDLF